MEMFAAVLLLCIINVDAIMRSYSDDIYDYIVVGGGTSGSVVAGRLSENPNHTVLVLEAGISDKEYPYIHIPNKCGTLVGTYIDWGFKTEPMKNACKEIRNKQSNWPTGKVLGGCSSHNFMDYIRGSRHDYDFWRDLGNEGWGYEDVLPYFKKLENNRAYRHANSDLHGTEGKITVEDTIFSTLGQSIVHAAEEMGYERLDVNGLESEGFDIAQLNSRYGRRISASVGYLWPAMDRTNLHIITEAHVTKVIIKDKTASGVQYIKNGHNFVVRARREVIVSAGALQSPKILMLSGIGPKQHLQDMGIEVIADLPVGEQLEDHIMTMLPFTVNGSSSLSITPEHLDDPWTLFNYTFGGTGAYATTGHQANSFHRTKAQPKEHKFPYMQSIYWASLTGISDRSSIDFRKFFGALPELWNQQYVYQRGRNGFVVFICLLHPRTTGTVRLKSTDAFQPPQFKMEYLEHPDDVKDIIEVIRINMKLIKMKTLRDIGTTYESPHHPGCKEHTFDTDSYWECFIRHKTLTVYHQASTCRMAPDKTGVVDSQLRVKGINNLRVVDTSIMPHVVSGNTMTPALMIGEKAADMIKQSARSNQ